MAQAPGRLGSPVRIAAGGIAVVAAVVGTTLLVRGSSDSDAGYLSSTLIDVTVGPAVVVSTTAATTLSAAPSGVAVTTPAVPAIAATTTQATSAPIPSAIASATTRATSSSAATTTASAPTPDATAASVTRSASTFESSVKPIDDATRAAMVGVTWREGCPVSLDDLRTVQVTYVGFDGRDHIGTLVVNASAADEMVTVFRRLYEVGFPVRKMIPIEVYGGDDDASTKDDNTSVFNCRKVSGSSTVSQHAFGSAIDINPLENPYVRRDGTVLDPVAEQFLDRSLGAPGMIVRGDAVVKAFSAVGWGWGGNFSSTKDYQHFSANGR